jgi:hypothetical protein
MPVPLLIIGAKVVGSIALGFVGEAIYHEVTKPEITIEGGTYDLLTINGRKLAIIGRNDEKELTLVREVISPYNEFWMDDNGDMYEDFEAAQGFRNKDLLKTGAFLIAGAFLLKNHKKLIKI